jgi:hypothetical protein
LSISLQNGRRFFRRSDFSAPQVKVGSRVKHSPHFTSYVHQCSKHNNQMSASKTKKYCSRRNIATQDPNHPLVRRLK